MSLMPPSHRAWLPIYIVRDQTLPNNHVRLCPRQLAILLLLIVSCNANNFVLSWWLGNEGNHILKQTHKKEFRHGRANANALYSNILGQEMPYFCPSSPSSFMLCFFSKGQWSDDHFFNTLLCYDHIDSLLIRRQVGPHHLHHKKVGMWQGRWIRTQAKSAAHNAPLCGGRSPLPGKDWKQVQLWPDHWSLTWEPRMRMVVVWATTYVV